jgi:three-Cys-motif partner protein
VATDVTSRSAPDAESLSCAIAGRYAGRWARGVARPQQEAPAAAWFVDGFAGADLQRAALRGATVQPAAVAAIQALSETTRIVLVEEDPGLISRLCEALDEIGAVERIRVTSDPAAAEPGDIALIEAPFARVAGALAAGIADAPALARLAPLAARSLPWTALEPIIHLPAADVLLRMPLEDFARQARFNGPLADLPPHIRRVVEGCSALLDDPRHGWIAAWREAQRTGGVDAATSAMTARMQALLGGADEARRTHVLPVEGAGGPIHLLLSSPHSGHAEELAAAVSDGAAARPKRPSTRKTPALPAPLADERRVADEPPAAAGPAAAPTGVSAGEEPAELEMPAAPPPQDTPQAGAPAEVLDLFAIAPESEPATRTPRAAAPRTRKTREPRADELGLFDEPE